MRMNKCRKKCPHARCADARQMFKTIRGMIMQQIAGKFSRALCADVCQIFKTSRSYMVFCYVYAVVNKGHLANMIQMYTSLFLTAFNKFCNIVT